MIPVFSYSDIVHADPAKKEIVEQYYYHSIKSAKQVGYSPIIYTNSDIFNNEGIEVLKGEPSYKLWDGMKIGAIDIFDENDLFVDGDITFHNRLVLDPNVDLHFDTYEVDNWKGLYKEQVLALTELGVEEVIPEWRVVRMEIFNCGVLHFKNQEFKKLYFDRWKKMEMFVEEHNQHLHRSKCTAVAAQYLLTLLANHYNISRKHFSEELRKPNYFYTHHAGNIKWKGRGILSENSLI